MAVISGWLAIGSLFLFSLWCASRKHKAAHAAAVVIWVILGLILAAVALAAFAAVRRRRRGCCGDCSACGAGCVKKDADK